MRLMIVGSNAELRQRVAVWIPISTGDQVVETKGILSALWHAEACHPDLIVLNAPSHERSARRVARLLKRTWPETSLLLHDSDGRLRPFQWSDEDADEDEGQGEATIQEDLRNAVLWYEPGLAYPRL